MKKSPQEIVRRTRGRDSGVGDDTLIGGNGWLLGAWIEAANDAWFEERRAA